MLKPQIAAIRSTAHSPAHDLFETMTIRRSKKFLVNPHIAVFKHIEDYFLQTAVRMRIQPFLHRLDSNLRCFVLREHEHAGGDAAESDIITAMLRRNVEARAVALRQLIYMLLHQKRGNDRTRFCQVTTKKFIK